MHSCQAKSGKVHFYLEIKARCSRFIHRQTLYRSSFTSSSRKLHLRPDRLEVIAQENQQRTDQSQPPSHQISGESKGLC